MAVLEVAVTPGAAADRVGPFADGVLRVRVTRPASDGEANRSMVRLVARALRMPPTALILIAGQRGRRKRIRIDALTSSDLEQRLRDVGDD